MSGIFFSSKWAGPVGRVAPSLIVLACVLQAQSVTVTPQTVGANVDESLVTKIIFVDQSDPTASDSNSGAKSAPLLTISAAVSMALSANRSGAGVEVLIMPGTYRESASLVANGSESTMPIVIEAQTPGSVVMAGSDVWGGWTAQVNGVYTHSWPYQWGLAPYPPGWAGNVTLEDIVRRREMIFVNGVSLEQQLDPSLLAAGSFYVDETNGMVSLIPPAGTNMGSAEVEVSDRTNLLYISGMHNLVIRGLVFHHENSFIQQGGPLQILNSANILVDNCQLYWNSIGGPLVEGSNHITVQQVVSNYNAFSGMAGYQVMYSLFSNIQTSSNNWRGLAGDFTDWDTAGGKFLLMHHDVFQGYTAVGNSAPGFWLDTDNEDVLVQNGNWTNNLLDGAFLEASEGPIQVSNSISANNGGTGLLFGDAMAVALSGNIFYGNQGGQVMISGQPGGRYVQNFETGQVYTVILNENISLSTSTISSATAAQAGLGTTLSSSEWALFLSTLASDQNTWFNSASTCVFQVLNGSLETLAQWQGSTNEDLHSTFTNPNFANPGSNNFSTNAAPSIAPPATVSAAAH